MDTRVQRISFTIIITVVSGMLFWAKTRAIEFVTKVVEFVLRILSRCLELPLVQGSGALPIGFSCFVEL
jgi:hypothetical protein